jgi:integrase
MKKRLDTAMRAEAKKQGLELERWTLHDLRRTLATNMQRLGVKHEVIEHLLNHREKARTGIAKVYQTHDYKPEKLAALQLWERRLDQIIQGASAVVVPFERRA